MAIVKNAQEIYDLQCRLCEESFKNPKVLPCLHSFCQSCLEQTVRGHERSVTCTRCHVDSPIPIQGMDSLPSNSFANNMLNILAVQNPTTCTNCEDCELATSRCIDCVENLCPNCVTAHERIRQTKGHKIITFEELQNNAVHDAIKCPSFCKIHDREMLKYFCETCDDAICRDCAIYEHREHHYVDLKEAVKLHRSSVTDLLDNTKRKIPVIRLALKEMDEVADSLNQRKELVTSLINETIETHIQKLEEKRSQLLNELEETYMSKKKVLGEQHEELNMDLDHLLTSCEFVENIMRYGNEAEIMTVKKLMMTRLHEMQTNQLQVEPEENDVIEFFQQDATLKEGIEKFGYLTTSETFPSICTAEGKGCRSAKVGHHTEFLVLAKNRFGKPVARGGDLIVGKLTDPSGISTNVDVTDNNNGTYTMGYRIMSKGKHTIAIYLRDKPIMGSPFDIGVSAGIDTNRIGPMLTKFGSAGITGTKNDENYEPWGVACDMHGSMVVTDHNNHKVQIFDSNGKLLFQFGVRGKDDGEVWYPTGVAVDKYNNIYVADHGNHRIQVFTDDGQYLNKFSIRGSNDGQLKGPCGIAIDHEDRLAVCDRDNHRVQVFTLDGRFIFSFGGSGGADGKLNSPRHITITPENHYLISDTNNFRVQRFDKNGKFISKFGSKGTSSGQFLCPSGLGVDSENNIVIADFKNIDVQLFNVDGDFIKKLGQNGLFVKPTGVCVTPNGNVLVADRGTHKVQLF